MTPEAARRVEVVGHGGVGYDLPGNSRRAIERALEVGVDRIEFDVLRSADGVLVLAHDEHLILDGVRRAVRGLHVDDLRRGLDDLLTLDELLELVGGRTRLLLDMKAHGYAPEIADALRRHGVVDRTIVSSTYALALRELRHLVPDLTVGLSSGHLASGLPTEPVRHLTGRLLSQLSPRPLIAVARRVGAEALMLQHRTCTAGMIAAAHHANLKVYPWTVDDPNRMDSLIALNVDALISNRPDVVQQRLALLT